jgi:CO dehydrogenase/acetyl-CoA synthase beta subunit
VKFLIDNKNTIKNVRDFLKKEHKSGKLLFSYQSHLIQNNLVFNSKIKIGLNKYKEIILEEETGLELGGINKKSFLILIPIKDIDLINHGKITLLGREVNKIKESSIDFGIILLVKISQDVDISEDELRRLNFISNGIEGFSIRTIPRRFWCRISKSALQKGFSFEFLGKAIIELYMQKFKDVVKSLEVIFINSYLPSIEQAIALSSEILSKDKERWKKKIGEWRKRIDCDYDWGCEICPYREKCYDIKQVLVSREEI